MPVPSEFQTKEYKECLELADELRRRIEAGEVVSVLAVTEDCDGKMSGASTSTENTFALFGFVLSWAMRRMGVLFSEEAKKS